MWRTVIVTKGERLTIKDNWLIVYSEDNEQRVPIGDLYSVVIDNRSALMSVAVITALALANVHIYFCDDKHNPVAVPPEGSVRVMTVTEKQYASMELLVGEKLATENLLDNKDILEL